MTTSNELRALLERVEGGSGRDFDLDCRLAWIFGLEPWSGAPEYHVGLCMPGSKTGKATPALTSSIDAAVDLFEKVLPGWIIVNLCEWDHETLRARGKWLCQMKRLGTQDDLRATSGKCNHAQSASRAVLAALLRAKLAQEERP